MDNYWTKRFNRRQVMRGAGGLAGVGALMAIGAACGDDDDSDETEETPAPGLGTSPAGQPTPSTAQPRSGGTLRMATQYEPPHLDPIAILAAGTHTAVGAAYSKLIKFKAGEGVSPTNFDVEPDLAGLPEQPDASTYIFTLKQGVKFHNVAPVNGRELTAEDVKYTFDRIRDPAIKSPQSYIFANVDRYEVMDAYTLKITMKRPQAVFLNYIGGSYTWIVAREVAEAGQLNAKAIGTGAFMLTEYSPAQRLVYKKHPEYFVSGRPYLDGVEKLIVPEYSTRTNSFRSGGLDIVDAASSADAKDLAQSNGKVLEYATAGGGFVFLNQRAVDNTIFRDPRVRQALMLGANWEQLNQVAYKGDGVIQGPLPVAFGPEWALTSEEILQAYYKNDPAAAKRLLEDAGASGTSMKGIQYNYGQNYLDAAQVFVQQWKQIGFELSISQVEYAASINALQNPESHFTVNVSAQSPFTSVDEWLGQFRTGNPRNFQGVSDPQFDALVDRLSASMDDNERKEIAKEAQHLLLSNAYAIPLCGQKSFSVMKKTVHGYAPHQGYGDLAFPGTWLEA